MSPRYSFADIKNMNILFPAAEREALAMGEPEPGAEHLVLAALGSAASAFARVGANPLGFREAVAAQHEHALCSVGIAVPDELLSDRIPRPNKRKGVFRSKGSAQQVFRRAVKLVQKEKSQLYGAYIVMVAAEMEAGTVVRALEHMTVEPGALALAARQKIDALNV
ncbi:MAG: hypothetical protein IIC71_14490 [Acidobacteria bacterium]|nr:hypothetical protein [Acidobacteriota bacterium]